MAQVPLTLYIDTAGPRCAVGLVRSGEVIASLSEPMTRGHDAALAPLVDVLFKSASLSPMAVSRIGVNVGPGSFTGVRVGVAFARGLALATGAEALGVTSLETLPPFDGGTTAYLACLPAKRRPPELTWWVQGFDAAAAPLTAPEECDSDGLERLAERFGAGYVLIEADTDAGALPALPLLQTRADPARIGQIAARSDPPLRPARPLYARAPDAVPMKNAPRFGSADG